MAEDTPSWSEKGKSAGSGDGEAKQRPSRPSKRDTSSTNDGESRVIRTPAGDGGDAASRKVAKAAATAGQRDLSFASRLGFPALVALICILGISAVVFARSTREALATPVQNLDHWHSVYGVYSCDEPTPEGNEDDDGNESNESQSKYIAPFQSTQDNAGIHSHGDGVLHIHPFFELSAGLNATFARFFEEMNVTMDAEAFTIQNAFDPPRTLTAGEDCGDGSGTARNVVLYWEWDFEAENGVEPTVITEGFDQIKFEHDREVFVFAHISEDTDVNDIPIPPQERFDALGAVSNDIEFQPETLVPRESGVDIDGDDAGADADAGADTEADADADADDGGGSLLDPVEPEEDVSE